MSISVSTKTGDKGSSGLANGTRLPKSALVFEVLGTQDELNSWLGVVIAGMDESFPSQKEFLLEVQNNLFYLGAELAQSPGVSLPAQALTKLEKNSQDLQQSMIENWTTQFLFPGGNMLAAQTDVARTVSRRLERLIVRYSEEVAVSSLVFKYINRLSDYLYVLRCFINFTQDYKENKFKA